MLNLALIGYGNMGRTHTRNLLQLKEQICIYCIYDIDPVVRSKAASDGYAVCNTLEELLDDAAIHACLIAVPNNYHKEISIACLNAGKHVICEKPAMLSLDELQEVLDTAKKNNRVFTVDQNRRWDRDYLIIKKIYNDRILGQPIFIDSRVQGTHSLPDNWLSRKGVGGMILDWGVHLIDQVLIMIPSPLINIYTQTVILPGKECEENSKIYLDFLSGEKVQLQVDTRCFSKLPRWHVMFEDGTAVISDISDCGTLFIDGGCNDILRDGFYTGSGPSRTLAPSEKVLAIPLNNDVDYDYIHNFYPNIVDAIQNGAELFVKPEEIIRTQKVLDLIKQSFETHQSIRCRI